MSSFTISTMRLPDNCESTFRLASAAGMEALLGNDNPNASTITAMVEAVPITAQCPCVRAMQASASTNSSGVICPNLLAVSKRHTSEVPISFPFQCPFSMGPPDITSVGILTLHAPITSEGVVLSQPQSNTTPSIGLALMDSSTSMLTRLRYNMAVGFINVSPNDITGNSTGKPPASSTPFFTASASSLKCPLQGVSSLQVLQMPITGLPSNISGGAPWFFIQARYIKPSLPLRPNQFWLRNLFSSTRCLFVVYRFIFFVVLSKIDLSILIKF